MHFMIPICTKSFVGRGFAPDPTGGAYSAPAGPLPVFRGLTSKLNRPPDRTWRRPSGRPQNKWLDKLRNDFTSPIGDLWRRAVDRGHGKVK